jgi:hypothetical protein
VEAPGRTWSELARRLHVDLLDVPGPARPLVNAGKMLPGFFNGLVDYEFSAKQRKHRDIPLESDFTA